MEPAARFSLSPGDILSHLLITVWGRLELCLRIIDILVSVRRRHRCTTRRQSRFPLWRKSISFCTGGKTINGQVNFTAMNPGFSFYAVSGVAKTQAEPTTVSTPAETAPPATPLPTSGQTTAVPTSQPAPGIPLSTIAIGGVFVLALIGIGYLVGRW
ncbi:hypothetical protein [Methanoplanus endosymbiosus]|uniref:Uncharacterized protein n=1 Tax=Methanoplanus endosymbiosus TaxID=33865 RepID=A0A9E7PL09_9EURY|nr:hypothetical protein [Methanoplanus endosymbiosus]UUX92120.1 hypothetical protein L6E24_12275 [Methanoplanus endosymbiosus]